jgi:hypothetical protein
MNMTQDAKGDTSSMRVFMLTWAAMLICLVIYVTLKTDALPDVPNSLTIITGLILSGKIFQNSQESKQ